MGRRSREYGSDRGYKIELGGMMPILNRCFCLPFLLCCGLGWRSFWHRDEVDVIFGGSLAIFVLDQSICY